VNLAPLMQKRITFTGSTLRARSVAEKGNIAATLRAAVWPKLDAGELRPVIHSTHPLTNAAEAHAELERGEHIGKIVLVVRP
jgi:NADPH:quinone reductase-like Zn-dependent oxidoreductase